MNDQQHQRKKIRMKIKTSIDTRFIFAASPKLTIQQVSDQIAKACQQFLPSNTKVKRIRALKKDDYYLRDSETVGDLVDDLDQIYCEVQLLGKKKQNQGQSRIGKEKKQKKTDDKSGEDKKHEQKSAQSNVNNSSDHQKSQKGKKEKNEKKEKDHSKTKEESKPEFKAPKSNFNADAFVKKLQEVEHPSEKSSRKNSAEKAAPKIQASKSKEKPKTKVIIQESDDSQS